MAIECLVLTTNLKASNASVSRDGPNGVEVEGYLEKRDACLNAHHGPRLWDEYNCYLVNFQVCSGAS